MSQHKLRSKIILYIALMVLLVSSASAEKYFVLDVNQIIGSVSFNSISLREIDMPVKYTDSSGFLVKTISFQNSEIRSFYLNMSENRNYLIYAPYSQNAARIEVYSLKNSKIMDIDVASFADTCGNNVCEDHESYESCTKDCKSGSKDDFCDEANDGICDPDCSPKTDADCIPKGGNQTSAIEKIMAAGEKTQNEAKQPEETGKKPNYLVWILSGLAVIIIILLFLFIRKRKENQIINSLKQYVSENIRRGFTLQQIKDVLFREGYSEKEIDRAVKSI